MKKRFTLLNLVLLLTIIFVSCHKDDRIKQKGLVGTWEISKIIIDKIDHENVSLEITTEILNPQVKQQVTFNTDGTIIGGALTLRWMLLENDTKLKVSYPTDDIFDEDFKIFEISIVNDTFIISFNNTEYTNSDQDDDGEFSFSKCDEKFNTRIADESNIEVDSREYYTRQ